MSGPAGGLATATSLSRWPRPLEPGLGEVVIASMVLGTEQVLNEYLLNGFQLMEEN